VYSLHPDGTTQKGVEVGRGVDVAATASVFVGVGVFVGGIGVGVGGVSCGRDVSVGVGSGVEEGRDVSVLVGVVVSVLVGIVVAVLGGGTDVDVSPMAMRSLSSWRVMTPLPKMVQSSTTAILKPIAICRTRAMP
jgi:hypothetical protein